MDNEHPPGKKDKGLLHEIKKRFRLSSKPRRSSGLPEVPPNASSEKDQQGSLTTNSPRTSTSALTGHSLSLPPASADNPTSESHMNPSAGLKITGRFIETLSKKLPEIVDGNPVKMATGLAKVIIEIKKGVEDNMDAVDRRIASTGELLATVAEALPANGWQANSEKERRCIERLKTALQNELAKLGDLSKECIGRKIVDYEYEKLRIAEIFERVNDARVQFGLETDLRIFKTIHVIQELDRRSLLKDLQPSNLADHKYHLEGEKREVLRRTVCTSGTRERLLNNIVSWAAEPSKPSDPSGPPPAAVYWLFGPAGSGKTTIAYTIAKRFELARPEDTIVLGGNFFSSRQFEETRFATRIIRTIVYHLALKCKPFADVLLHCGKLDTVHQNVRAQLDGLLIEPWQASESDRLADSSTPPAQYLIVLDALDEIEGNGGSEFLRELFSAINANRLDGLKFFATSRPDPNLEAYVRSFAHKELYRLQDVPLKEAEEDIRTYLTDSLPSLAQSIDINRLVGLAAGLFIYAATVIKHLERRTKVEQKKLVNRLLPRSDTSSATPQTSLGATALLDHLYRQILSDAFNDHEDDILIHRRRILHTFLCTAERTTASVVANLLDADQPEPDIEAANQVATSLYAVLYIDDNKVLWYHKSFPDFLFDHNRSKEFWCDQAEHHQRLVNSTFRVMEKELRFNIANIKSSFIFDCKNDTLLGAVRDNISSTLSYSCRNWDWHLRLSSTSPSAAFNPLHKALSEFLEDRALFWIEAMNLLGSSGLCDRMLRNAAKWVTSTNAALGAQLAEAASFAVYFSGSLAASSTPHLYISALSTWPRDLEPCRRWRGHFPGIPAFKNATRGGALSLVTIRAQAPVYSVAFSPDGTRTVSGSSDKLMRVWDVSTGKELNELVGHTGIVNSVAFSTDGTRIVSGSWDTSVRVWDVSTGKELNKLVGHTGIVTSVTFSTDGTRIVSGSHDKSVRVWDVLTGKELNKLVDHTGEVTSVALSTDGTRIVSGSYDTSVRVWDVSTGKELYKLVDHTGQVTSVAFSTDGTRIVSGSWDESVRVWDVPTGKELNELVGHAGVVNSVAFSTDGTRIVSGSLDKSVRVWDVSTGKELNELVGHTSGVNSVAFSTDGTRIVSGSWDKSVRVWDVSTGKELNELVGHTGGVNSVAFSMDGARIVSGSLDKSVRVWDVSTGKELNELVGHTGEVYSVAFSTDGQRIVSGSYDNSVRVWDMQPGYYLRQQTKHTSSPMHTGWLLCAHKEDCDHHYLMFVPPDALLPDSSNILTIPHYAASSVGFANAQIGSQWHRCYQPKS